MKCPDENESIVLLSKAHFLQTLQIHLLKWHNLELLRVWLFKYIASFASLSTCLKPKLHLPSKIKELNCNLNSFGSFINELPITIPFGISFIHRSASWNSRTRCWRLNGASSRTRPPPAPTLRVCSRPTLPTCADSSMAWATRKSNWRESWGTCRAWSRTLRRSECQHGHWLLLPQNVSIRNSLQLAKR